ncbi:MAG: OadG family protein [Prolixibacteraceae bacterium]|nr:OadG family protein [Prolixibacteraceae bacterium]
MSENFELALQLLGIGMVTVFIILFLVILIGSAIIKFVNRFVPEAPKVVSTRGGVSAGIPSGKMAAIVAAVKIATNGKGKVTSIEKE